MRSDISALFHEQRGHFALASGRHSRAWLDLERLFRSPKAVRPLALELAARLHPYAPDVVCGPLVEGALLALLVAEALEIDFAYALRHAEPSSSDLVSAHYALPKALGESVRGRRVAVVDPIVDAGPALRGALTDLAKYAAEAVVIGSLLSLGAPSDNVARNAGLPFDTLDADTNEVWAPARCPLCASGVPLTPHPSH